MREKNRFFLKVLGAIGTDKENYGSESSAVVVMRDEEGLGEAVHHSATLLVLDTVDREEVGRDDVVDGLDATLTANSVEHPLPASVLGLAGILPLDGARVKAPKDGSQWLVVPEALIEVADEVPAGLGGHVVAPHERLLGEVDLVLIVAHLLKTRSNLPLPVKVEVVLVLLDVVHGVV